MLKSVNWKALTDEFLYQYGRARSHVPYLLRRPLGYFLYITGDCNLDCGYCWQRHQEDLPEQGGWVNSTPRVLSPEDWIKVVDNLPKRAFIGLSGGEATISPALLSVVKAAGGRHPISINTNLMSIKDRELEALTHRGVRNLSISLDGFAEVHDVSRSRKGLFDKIVENIHRINEIKGDGHFPLITIKTVLMNENLDRMAEFRRYCAETLRADEINISFEKLGEHRQFSLFHNRNLADVLSVSKPVLYQYEEPEKVINVLAGMLEGNRDSSCKLVVYPRMRNREQLQIFVYGNGKNVYRPCYLPLSMVTVLPDGEVIPCLSVSLGNVREYDYSVSRVLENGAYESFWKTLVNWPQLPSACDVCCFNTVKSE